MYKHFSELCLLLVGKEEQRVEKRAQFPKIILMPYKANLLLSLKNWTSQKYGDLHLWIEIYHVSNLHLLSIAFLAVLNLCIFSFYWLDQNPGAWSSICVAKE